MIQTVESVGVFAGTSREARVGDGALVGASVALDSAAAAILLGAVPLPAPIGAIVVMAAHVIAILLLSSVTSVRPSRLWLCLTATLAVPCVGAAVAIAVLVTKGRGKARKARERTGRLRRKLTVAAIERMATALSPCDAMQSGDEDERRIAVLALSRDGGPAAIALLRRATAHPDPDVALSAALVLDELGARAEQLSDRAVASRPRPVARAERRSDRAVAPRPRHVAR